MRKIYVASSWRNEYQPNVVKELLANGHAVYDFRNPEKNNFGFSWSQIDKEWENWTTENLVTALKHPIAEKGFNLDFAGMTWSDTCILVLPCGRSAHTEAGYMAGCGKDVLVYSPTKQEPELMYKIFDGIYSSLSQLISIL